MHLICHHAHGGPPKPEEPEPDFHGHSHGHGEQGRDEIFDHMEFNKQRASKAKNIRVISNVYSNMVNDHKRDKIKKLVEKQIRNK